MVRADCIETPATAGSKEDLFVKMGRLEEARIAYGRVIRLEPDNTYFYKDSAEILFKLGRYEEALDALTDSLYRNPSIASWYVERAEINRQIAEKTLNMYKELLESAEKESTQAANSEATKDIQVLQ